MDGTEPTRFQWEPQPAAKELVDRLLLNICSKNTAIDELAKRLKLETGTRLFDWVDSIYLHDTAQCATDSLEDAGFVSDNDARSVWRLPCCVFPTVVLGNAFFTDSNEAVDLLAIKVDDVEDFNRFCCDGSAHCVGTAGSQLRVALVPSEEGDLFAAIERHGWPQFDWPKVSSRQIAQANKHLRNFEQRTRTFENCSEGFQLATALVEAATVDLGVDWACDLFFQAERIYWQSGNDAAQEQYQRHQRLGLGWANHFHHTYRSSRACFAELIQVLETLGFECREHFHAGEGAAWGAQKLEQSRAGIIAVAEVDVTPDEVTDDFVHKRLTPCKELGTVGLWCAQHGESFLQTGLFCRGSVV